MLNERELKAVVPQGIQMVAQFIKDVGFPIFVAVYVLMRLEPVLSSINTSVAELTKAIAILSERISMVR